MDIQAAPLSEIDPVTLHAIVKLRVDVFVVEQDCAYPELDGRDAEPGTLRYRIWSIPARLARHARDMGLVTPTDIGRIDARRA